MNTLVSPKHLPRVSIIAFFSIGLAFSLITASAAQQQQREQPAAPAHDMAHMHHNHDGFMQQGMHHAVAKGTKLEQQVDGATHTITLREGPFTLPANTDHMKMPQPPDVFWTIPLDAFLRATLRASLTPRATPSPAPSSITPPFGTQTAPIFSAPIRRSTFSAPAARSLTGRKFPATPTACKRETKSASRPWSTIPPRPCMTTSTSK